MTRALSFLHGDPGALQVARARVDLRAGRPVRVCGPATARIAIPIDTLRPPVLAALLRLSGADLRLAFTRERAAALGAVQDDAIAVPVSAAVSLAELRAMAGADVASEVSAAASAGLLPRASSATEVERAALALRRIPRPARWQRARRGAGRGVDPAQVTDVRVHSSCLTGDLLGSLRCDCGDQLRGAVRRFAGLGAGVLLYVGQEGRGIGLANKLRAYRLQETGLDAIDADRHLGFAGDERRHELAAALLRELGIARVRLHTNNPRKAGALAALGVTVVDFRTLAGAVNPHIESYIRVRRERAGHVVPDGQ